MGFENKGQIAEIIDNLSVQLIAIMFRISNETMSYIINPILEFDFEGDGSLEIKVWM